MCGEGTGTKTHEFCAKPVAASCAVHSARQKTVGHGLCAVAMVSPARAARARPLSTPPGLSRPRAAARYTAIGGRTPPPHTGGGSPGERGAGPGGGAPPAATAASVRQRESTQDYRRKADSGIHRARASSLLKLSTILTIYIKAGNFMRGSHGGSSVHHTEGTDWATLAYLLACTRLSSRAAFPYLKYS